MSWAIFGGRLGWDSNKTTFLGGWGEFWKRFMSFHEDFRHNICFKNFTIGLNNECLIKNLKKKWIWDSPKFSFWKNSQKCKWKWSPSNTDYLNTLKLPLFFHLMMNREEKLCQGTYGIENLINDFSFIPLSIRVFS